MAHGPSSSSHDSDGLMPRITVHGPASHVGAERSSLTFHGLWTLNSLSNRSLKRASYPLLTLLPVSLVTMFSSASSFLSLSIFNYLLLLLLCFHLVNSSSTTTKIGNGYRLISLKETPDGGIGGLLQVKERNNIYGPDIPLLQLYVK
jgi:hypothetical protein